jgi:hypothetical protein
MRITLSLLTGAKYTLDVSALDTVGDIKEQLQRLQGYAPRQCRVCKHSCDLGDSFTLQDYGVVAGDKLDLILPVFLFFR